MKIIKSIIKFFLRPFIKIYRDLKTKKLLKKSRNFNNDGPVVFICQCEYIWNKIRNVFIELKNSNIFTYLYIVEDKLSVNNTNFTIFEKEFREYCILYNEKKLIELKPSLVIYTRPYENYLPKDLRVNKVQNYSRIAYIPYYFSLEKEYGLNDMMYKKINFYFADNTEDYKYFTKLCAKNIKRNYQKAFDYGYPVFETLLDYSGINVFKMPESLKVIWTPRWTVDLKFGGSNFLKYKDDLFKLMLDNREYSLVFRPHPMLFSNFIKNAILSENEKNELINVINNSTNIYYDTRSEYIDTFLNSNILITDNSSIVVEYFLTGKPIIYCYNDSDLVFNEQMEKILECNYVANDFENIKFFLELLKKDDPKKHIRKKEISNFIGKHFGTSKRIASEIALIIKK